MQRDGDREEGEKEHEIQKPREAGEGGWGALAQREGKTQIQSERATESHEEEGPKHQQTKKRGGPQESRARETWPHSAPQSPRAGRTV